MSEIRNLIERLVASGVDPVEAGEVVALAAVAGASTKSRSDQALRQERYRERNKASQNVTSDAADGVAPLPSKETPHTPKETQPTLPTTPKEKTPKGVQKKAVRLPDDWQLPLDWRQDAVDQGLPPQRIDIEAAKMRDWSRSSPNGAKLDWRASWRNWCRGAAEKMTPQGRGPPTRAVDDFIDSLVTRMDRADADPPAEIDGYQEAPRRLPAY